MIFQSRYFFSLKKSRSHRWSWNCLLRIHQVLFIWRWESPVSTISSAAASTTETGRDWMRGPCRNSSTLQGTSRTVYERRALSKTGRHLLRKVGIARPVSKLEGWFDFEARTFFPPPVTANQRVIPSEGFPPPSKRHRMTFWHTNLRVVAKTHVSIRREMVAIQWP